MKKTGKPPLLISGGFSTEEDSNPEKDVINAQNLGKNVFEGM